MGKIMDLYRQQVEEAAQLEKLLGQIGTVIVMQNKNGAGGEALGMILTSDYGFKYYGRGVHAKPGYLGKVIVVLDRHKDGTPCIKSIDVYKETTVISEESHFKSTDRKRPNILCMTATELEEWQTKFDTWMETELE